MLQTTRDPGWIDRPQVVDLADTRLRFELTPRDSIGRAIYLYGVFEISVTRCIQAYLRPGMTFLDVGANAGYYSVLAAKCVGRQGRIHAFEPEPKVRARLKRNLQLNDLNNVAVHPEAVSRTTGFLPFYVSTDPENHGTSSTLPGEGRTLAVEQVRSVTLDEFCAREGIELVALMKVDVEGAEGDVWAGGMRTLAGLDAPALVFESFAIESHRPVLEGLGYRIFKLDYEFGAGLGLYPLTSTHRSAFDSYEAPNYVAYKLSGASGVELHRFVR